MLDKLINVFAKIAESLNWGLFISALLIAFMIPIFNIYMTQFPYQANYLKLTLLAFSLSIVFWVFIKNKIFAFISVFLITSLFLLMFLSVPLFLFIIAPLWIIYGFPIIGTCIQSKNKNNLLRLFELTWGSASILLFVIGITAASFGLMPNDVGIYVWIWMPGLIILSFPLGIVGLIICYALLSAFETHILGYDVDTHISYISYVCFEWLAVVSCGIVQYKFMLKFFCYCSKRYKENRLHHINIKNET